MSSTVPSLKVKVAQSCPTLCDPMNYIKSMDFSRPEYRSGYPFPSPGDLPNSGIEPRPPAWQADSLRSEPPGIIPHLPHKAAERTQHEAACEVLSSGPDRVKNWASGCSCLCSTRWLGTSMTNLDSELKSRDSTLLTKVLIVKAMVLPVRM